ncbi:hypothetical protein ACFWG0_26580 [Streptomyces yangpuensis]|uniref:hypothetical protein n=1 Tax=Streptomyces yangpuensis TaxID=1648182 RepID=UPI00364E5224
MSLDDYDRLYEEARDEPAFSNGDEGYSWIDANCSTCIHDKEQRDSMSGGCPLILISLMGRTPIQWLDQKQEGRLYSRQGQYQCIEYRHEDDGPVEPQPIPDPPGQLTLAPRDDFEGVRMLTPLPEPEAVSR